MSNIDKQAQRDIAAAAESAPLWHAVGVFGEVVSADKPEWKPVHDFCKTFTAERVLALLNELEAAEKRNAELTESYGKLRDTMTAIHNAIRLSGASTSLSTILTFVKRSYEDSAAAADKGE